jgi:DNA-directed RNA polymerase specialized sigma subunit
MLGVAGEASELSDEKLVARYQKESCCDSAEALLRRYRSLIRAMASDQVSISRFPADLRDDVECVMKWAVVQAMGAYDAARGASFRTYARTVAANAGRDFLDMERRHSGPHIRYLDACPTDSEREELIGSSRSDADGSSVLDPPILIQWAEVMGALAQKMGSRDLMILRIVHSGGTEGDISRAARCSRAAARVARNRALTRARKIVEEYRMAR